MAVSFQDSGSDGKQSVVMNCVLRSGYAQLDARDVNCKWIMDSDDGIIDEPGKDLDLETVQMRIRAVHTFHLVQCFGQVFDGNIKPRTEEEAAALFQRSQDVDEVDHFVSHSWQGSRILKWA
eukprot:938945-Amphidinium_carterae.1